MITYPTTPDLTVEVGDYVRSFDFPGRSDCYIEGVVKAIDKADGRYTIQSLLQVFDSKSEDRGDLIKAPINGLVGIFGLTRGVQKVLVG